MISTRLASRHFPVLTSLLLALSACTALPPPRDWIAPASSGERTDTSEVEPGEEPVDSPREAPPARLTWDGALELARQNSPGISVALARIARADARLDEARARAYPRLDARASWVRFIEAASFRGRTGSDVSGDSTRTRFFTGRGSDIYSTGVDFTYPLFDGGVVYRDRQAQEEEVEASRHDSRDVLAELELRVSSAYLDVLLANGEIEIAEESLNFTREQERLARAREEAGEGLQVDRLRFAARASEEQLALNRARASLRVRIAVLAELTGVPLDETVEFARPTKDFVFPSGDLLETALATRPELLALRARTRSAGHRVESEVASRWPSLDLFASYGFLGLDDTGIDTGKDEFQVGAAVSLNLFEGGASVARRKALEEEAEELRGQERELTLAIEREVLAAQFDLELARENVRVSQETLRLSREVLERVAAQYRVGEARVVDVTEVELQRTRARLASLRSEVHLLLAGARLHRATGAGHRETVETAEPDER